ncbi:MAG: DUF3618 domain-containing protein [Stellaceae bacterium]|jgi:hypothetical protein
MESQSERLEREAEEIRAQLAETLEELRTRMTPGRVVDQVIDYTRDSPAAEFLRNLRREVRENPMPLVLMGIGIVWLLLASNRTSRTTIASTADMVVRKADHIAKETSAAVSRTSEWGQQRAERLIDRASDAATAGGNTTAGLTDRARDVAGRLTEKTRSASATTFEKTKRPFTGVSEDARTPITGDAAAPSRANHKEDACAVEPTYEPR